MFVVRGNSRINNKIPIIYYLRDRFTSEGILSAVFRARYLKREIKWFFFAQEDKIQKRIT